jgi:spore coat protein E
MDEKASFREIITKAVCGNGTQTFRYTELLSTPSGRTTSSILGSSVTRLKLTEPLVTEVSNNGSKNVRVSGTFDINVWYAYNNDQATDVAKETIKFTELIPINEISENIVGQVDARVVLVKAPRCLKTVIAENAQIQIDVELGIYAEIVGETKVFVHVYE